MKSTFIRDSNEKKMNAMQVGKIISEHFLKGNFVIFFIKKEKNIKHIPLNV